MKQMLILFVLVALLLIGCGDTVPLETYWWSVQERDSLENVIFGLKLDIEGWQYWSTQPCWPCSGLSGRWVKMDDWRVWTSFDLSLYHHRGQLLFSDSSIVACPDSVFILSPGEE